MQLSATGTQGWVGLLSSSDEPTAVMPSSVPSISLVSSSESRTSSSRCHGAQCQCVSGLPWTTACVMHHALSHTPRSVWSWALLGAPTSRPRTAGPGAAGWARGAPGAADAGAAAAPSQEARRSLPPEPHAALP
eukprot:scaffold28291_cov63-Phaeocystis_antarctica.AAC.5